MLPGRPGRPTTNREPTADERANCRPYLQEEIEQVGPAVVVPTVVPLLHPSYQNIWIPRIGHTDDSYRTAIADVLDSV